jgi:hypothetical protein
MDHTGCADNVTRSAAQMVSAVSRAEGAEDAQRMLGLGAFSGAAAW